MSFISVAVNVVGWGICIVTLVIMQVQIYTNGQADPTITQYNAISGYATMVIGGILIPLLVALSGGPTYLLKFWSGFRIFTLNSSALIIKIIEDSGYYVDLWGAWMGVAFILALVLYFREFIPMLTFCEKEDPNFIRLWGNWRNTVVERTAERWGSSWLGNECYVPVDNKQYSESVSYYTQLDQAYEDYENTPIGIWKTYGLLPMIQFLMQRKDENNV